MRMVLIILPAIIFAQNIKFPPTPIEDSINGRNENCYLTAIGHPTEIEKIEFINSLYPFVKTICPKLNLPSKTVMAMLILESGFGFTRTGYYANNLGGVKKWTKDTANVYVLKGQPDENNGNSKILMKTKKEEIIFDELNRIDNR